MIKCECKAIRIDQGLNFSHSIHLPFFPLLKFFIFPYIPKLFNEKFFSYKNLIHMIVNAIKCRNLAFYANTHTRTHSTKHYTLHTNFIVVVLIRTQKWHCALVGIWRNILLPNTEIQTKNFRRTFHKYYSLCSCFKYQNHYFFASFIYFFLFCSVSIECWKLIS